MTDFPMDGRCSCGSVHYQIGSKPIFVHCCHCRSCQRESGAAFALNAMIEADRVVLTRGEPETVLTPSDGGKGQKVTRCPDCKVAVWSHYGGRGQLSFIRVGALDDPAALPPDIHIYTRSRLPWVALPAGVPAVEAYYDSKKLWPAESLARRKALFG